jgi:hypothetical protein
MSGYVGGAIVGGALINAWASNQASNQAAEGQQNAINSQQGMFNTIQNNNQPYMQAGQNALNQLSTGTSAGGQFTHQFNANDLKTNLAPNYQWQLDQGLQATQNAANLQGGLSGNQLKAVNDYAQNYAGNAYQQAFANYNTNQTNIFNRLSAIADLGQNAAAQTGNNGAQISSGIANSSAGLGAAQAAGTVGSANALSNGLTGAAMWSNLGNNGTSGSSNPSWYQSYQNNAGVNNAMAGQSGYTNPVGV